MPNLLCYYLLVLVSFIWIWPVTFVQLNVNVYFFTLNLINYCLWFVDLFICPVFIFVSNPYFDDYRDAHLGCLLLSPRRLTFTSWGCWNLGLWHVLTELAHSFLFCSCVRFCLYGPFNCISFHKFSRQLSAFLHSSSRLVSALLVLSTVCLFMKVSLSSNIILCGWLGLKHRLTN